MFAYIGLILLLRISGKQTRSKMNAFDFVVTVALASILVSKDVALVQGLLAFAMLIGLQYLITWSTVRAAWMRRLVTGEPTLLVHRGRPLSEALRRPRVTEPEIAAAVRSAGLPDVGAAEAVILETDGSFSVVGREAGVGKQDLAGVRASLSDTKGSDPVGRGQIPSSVTRP